MPRRPILPPAHAAFLKRAFELDELSKRIPEASLGDKPGTVQFKTPSGHTVTTPYDAQTVTHQVKRLGGVDPYYAKLKATLEEQGRRTDRGVERDRTRAVEDRRSSNMVGGGTLGGLAGAGLGALAGHFAGGHGGVGALAGGLAGALGGGYLGHNAHVDRQSGPTSRRINEIEDLYQEPEHVKETRRNLENVRSELAAERFQRQMDRHFDRWDRYDRYDSRYRYPGDFGYRSPLFY